MEHRFWYYRNGIFLNREEVEEDEVGRVSDVASIVKNFIIVSSLRGVSYFSIIDEVISAEKE